MGKWTWSIEWWSAFTQHSCTYLYDISRWEKGTGVLSLSPPSWVVPTTSPLGLWETCAFSGCIINSYQMAYPSFGDGGSSTLILMMLDQSTHSDKSHDTNFLSHAFCIMSNSPCPLKILTCRGNIAKVSLLLASFSISWRLLLSVWFGGGGEVSTTHPWNEHKSQMVPSTFSHATSHIYYGME